LPDDLAGGVIDFHTEVGWAASLCSRGRRDDGDVDLEVSIRGGQDVDGAQVNARSNLDFDALPEAAGLDIPTLFPVGNLRVVDALHDIGFRSRVCHPHRNLVFARAEQGSDVKLEGSIAAFVRPDLLPVDVDIGKIINRSKAQHGNLVRRRRLNVHGAPVPGHSGVVPQVRELGLPRGWDARRAHIRRCREFLDVQGATGIREEVPIPVQRNRCAPG